MSLREVVIQFNSRFDPRGMLALMSTMSRAKTEAEVFESTLKRITTAFVAMGSASLLAFKQYEASLTEFAGKAMNTADEFSNKFSKISGKIARDTGLIRHEVFRGLQEGTSALLAPLDAAIVAKKSAILAAGKQARMPQAMSVSLSGYRNKFGLPAKVLDYTYSSAQLGQGQVAEFAPAWQYVLGFARGAGLELKEVAAGIAAISATAPSPLMGATQFGAFLTGIARGSTYEQKLIEGSGKTSQDLRDMLRHQGLAHTVEFLASKFTGDELQQVFGRKEFVQFIQGTTGRRGIVAKLEKLIVENAKNQPIEKFGKDLEKTLANKWDRFLRTFEQMGSEFGEPISVGAKLLLQAGQKMMEVVIGLNNVTSGLLSWGVFGGGLAVGIFALLDKGFQMFLFGLMARITGMTNVFYNRYKDMGAAGMGAAKGERLHAARMAGEAEASARAHAKAAGTSAAYDAMNARATARQAADAAAASSAAGGPTAGAAYDTMNARAKARAAADAAAAARASGGPTAGAAYDTMNARAKARAAADAAAAASASSNKAQFDTGAKAWNDARREEQLSKLRAFAKEGRDGRDYPSRPEWIDKGPVPKGPLSPEMQESVRRVNEQAKARYFNHAARMNNVVDDMIKSGYIRPEMKKAALHNLMTIPSEWNDNKVFTKPSMKSYEDLLKNTGYEPPNAKVNPFPQDHVKKGHKAGFHYGNWAARANYDDMLYKQFRGKGLGRGDIRPDMVMKSKRHLFDAISILPWLDPTMYYQKNQEKVKNFADPFRNANKAKKPRRGRRGSAAPLLLGLDPYWWESFTGANPDYEPHRARHRPGGEKRKGRGRFSLGGWGWDLFAHAAAFSFADLYQSTKAGGPFKKSFGFSHAVGGGGLDDMLGSIDSINEKRKANGQKEMNKNIARMTFFMGKFWRMALSPWTLIPAATMAAFFGAQSIFNNTEAGRANARLMEYRENSLFNQQKILEYQAKQAWELYKMLREAHDERNPPSKGNGGVANLLADLLQDPVGTTTDILKNEVNLAKKYLAAQAMLNHWGQGKMTEEETVRMFSNLWEMGVDALNPYKLPGIERPLFYPTFRDGHGKSMRLVTGEMSAEEFSTSGRSSLTGFGVHPALVKGIPYLEEMARTGPLGARLDFAAAREIHFRATGQKHAVHYMPIKNVVNLYVDDREAVAEIVSDEIYRKIYGLSKDIERNSSSDVDAPIGLGGMGLRVPDSGLIPQ